MLPRLVRVGVPRMLVRLLDGEHSRRHSAARSVAEDHSPVLRCCLLLGNALLQDGYESVCVAVWLRV